MEESLLNDDKSMTFEWLNQIHRIISVKCTSYDGKDYNHMVWCDKDFVNTLEIKKLFIDATFRCRPKMRISRTKSQFLTIMAEISTGEVFIKIPSEFIFIIFIWIC